MDSVYIDAVGLAAPGLPSWKDSIPILNGSQPYSPIALEKYKPSQLPPNEARRATELVRMAFRVCEDAMNNTLVPMRDCASVFASSGGDFPIVDQICRSLCEPERLVSPTLFHNSVHNSAAGYWSIATGSRLPSNSISAYNDSFCIGLLEAISFCSIEQLPTLLAVYDIKIPYPLNKKRNISTEFGVAFILNSTRSTESLAQIKLSLLGHNIDTTPTHITFAELYRANPAARSLPLLEMLAHKKSGTLIFSNNNLNSYQLELTICR